MKPRKTEPRQVICHWCGHDVKHQWHSPIPDCPGAHWIVCGPYCPQRPETARMWAS